MQVLSCGFLLYCNKTFLKYTSIRTTTRAEQRTVTSQQTINLKSNQPAQQALGSSGRKREQARARETRKCLLLARPSFLVPTTSKRLLRRLKSNLNLCSTVFVFIQVFIKQSKKIVPHLALELVASVRLVYEVKFNLGEPPAFNDALHPGRGDQGLPTIAYTRRFCLKRGTRIFEALIKVYQRQGNHC